MTPARNLTLLKVIALSLLAIVGSNYIIRSPRVTTWGSWGPAVYCPEGQYVTGVQLKVEPIRETGLLGYSDNTALNAIRLYCGHIGKPLDHHNLTALISEEGSYGSWGTVLYCPERTYVTGFQLRSQTSQGANVFSWFFGLNANDDTAANNLNLFCSDKHTVEGYGTWKGSWTQAQNCLERQAVCGFQTQVEPYKDKGDDSGLNNVDMVCCHINNPVLNCTPEETWDVVKECDNTEGVTPLTCGYQKRIGVTHSKLASQADIDAYTDLGFDSVSIATMLMTNLGSRSEPGSSRVWKSGSFEIRQEETVHSLTFSVPPGYKTELSQVVGTCGLYEVRTPKFIRSDTNMLNQTSIHELLEEHLSAGADTATSSST